MGNNLSVKTDDVLTASMVARLYATMDWALPKNGLDLGAPSPLNSYLIICVDVIKNDQLRPDGLAYEDEARP